MKKYKTFTLILIALCVCFYNLWLNGQIIQTPAEENGYSRYTQYDELSDYLSLVKSVSKNIVIKIVGRTMEGGDINLMRDIYLVILTENRASSHSETDSSKPTIFILGAQHGDEQSGKEAALVLIRELGMGRLNPLLKKVNVLIIPQMNPWGNEVDRRRNEQNLDMNRDHIKLEAPPVEAAHKVFAQWLPEVTIDVHEKGRSYYELDIGVVSNLNIDRRLQDYSRSKILPFIAEQLREKDFTFHEYLVRQPIGGDISSGAISQNQQQEREYLTRYSTTDINDGRNSFGIYNTLSFIYEKSSDGTINGLKRRTEGQLIATESLIKFVADNASKVKQLVKECRDNLAVKGREYLPDDFVHIRMEYVEDATKPPLILKKHKDEELILGELMVDKKKGELLRLTELDRSKRGRKREVEEVQVKNWRPTVKSLLMVSRPLAYYIPKSHKDLVDTILRHNIKVQQIVADKPIEIQCYKVQEILASQRDYLAPQKLEVELLKQQIVAKKGDFIVSCNQLASNQIVLILEPQSRYGLIRYFKYNLVPQVGDIFPIYRIVTKNDLKTVNYKGWFLNP